MRRKFALVWLLLLTTECSGPPDDSSSQIRKPPAQPDLTDMVRVPGGRFRRGVDDRRGRDEGPGRVIRLRPFHIDRFEVSNDRFAEFANATGHVTSSEADPDTPRSWRRPGADGEDAEGDHPVVYVTWEDARAYCAWRHKRLPTEAEWELAARGTDGRQWPWGPRPDPSRANGWGEQDPFSGTAPVGAFPVGVSPSGASDMAGNVWEWCADWYDPDYYLVAPKRDPLGPERGSLRVVRGGSWTNPITVLRTTNRHAVHPEEAGPSLGFRCVAE